MNITPRVRLSADERLRLRLAVDEARRRQAAWMSDRARFGPRRSWREQASAAVRDLIERDREISADIVRRAA